MRHILTAIVFILMASQSALIVAQEMNIQERMIYRRAVEAAVWSMPLMNFLAMRDGIRDDGGAGFNAVAYNSKVQNWRLQVTTANNTTPYIFIFWNLEDGPVVIDIPPSADGVSLFGTLMDAWQRPLEDVGARGKDQGRGAKYLLLPPGYQGPFSAEYISLLQKTYNGYTLMRPVIAGATDENLKKAEAFVKQIKVYPLAKADNPPATRFVDLYDKDIDGIARFDASYFDKLNSIIQEEVIEEKDLAMMGVLRGIGIEKGQPFKVDARRKEILEAAAGEAHEYLIDLYFNTGITPLVYEDRGWSVLTPMNGPLSGLTWEMPGYVDVDGRGASYYAFFTSVKNFDLFSPPTMYLLSSKDTAGAQLTGAENYKLNVPGDVPIQQFWSVIAYATKDATFFDNQPKAGVSSLDPGVKVNGDGSVDVYFGPKAPGGKEANWVPTTPGEDFFLYFRLYQPTEKFFTREWKLNDVEKGW